MLDLCEHPHVRQDRGRAEEIVEMQGVGEVLPLPGLQLEPLPAGQQEPHYGWQHLVAFLPPIFSPLPRF